MSLLSNADQISKKKKIAIALSVLGGLLVVGILFFLIYMVPRSNRIDFTSIRKNIGGGITPRTHFDKDMKSIFASEFSASEAEKQFTQERTAFIKESRSRAYTEDALIDYYKNNFEEAFRRVERAIFYDHSNFIAARLKAQMNLELRKYKKAYDDLERARQIPNEDSTIVRDMEILRKLMRYTRIEIDRLQRYVHANPNDDLARARLDELCGQMQE